MAFGAKQIFPIDLNKSAAVGVNIPFAGPGALVNTATSGSILPINKALVQTPFVSNFTTSDAIKNNLINYFLTNVGERPLNPTFGGGLRAFIFEQISNNSLSTLESKFKKELKINFPLIKIEELQILQQEDENIITLYLSYSIKNTGINDNLQINFA